MHPQELEADVPLTQGNNPSDRINGLSNSTRDMGVSGLSAIREQKTSMAELGIQERGLGEGAGREEHIVSPTTPTATRDSAIRESMMGRARGVVGNSPAVSSPSEAAWSPSTPVQRTGTRGSRFEERWS